MIFSLVRFGSVRFVHTVMLSSYAVMLVFPLKWDSLLFTRIDRIWPVCKRKRATDWERRERESGRMNVVTKWKKEMMVLNAQYIRWITHREYSCARSLVRWHRKSANMLFDVKNSRFEATQTNSANWAQRQTTRQATKQKKKQNDAKVHTKRCELV